MTVANQDKEPWGRGAGWGSGEGSGIKTPTPNPKGVLMREPSTAQPALGASLWTLTAP